MNAPETIVEAPTGFIARLRAAGIEPGDSAEVQLGKSLLTVATGLVVAATVVWVALYQFLGLRVSATLPLVFQLLLAGNLLVYLVTRNFDWFRASQLGLFLFLPFVAHWTAGNVVTSSGVVLWSVMAPVGALLGIGLRQSLGWFVAWVVLLAVSSAADYYLADSALAQPVVPLRVSIVFFSLNFAAIVSMVYALMFFAVSEKRRIQERLEQSRRQFELARDTVNTLML